MPALLYLILIFVAAKIGELDEVAPHSPQKLVLLVHRGPMHASKRASAAGGISSRVLADGKQSA